MKLFDMLSQRKVLHKKALLLKNIELSNGVSRHAGASVNVLIDLGNGKYHIEDNDFSCTVNKDEISMLEN